MNRERPSTVAQHHNRNGALDILWFCSHQCRCHRDALRCLRDCNFILSLQRIEWHRGKQIEITVRQLDLSHILTLQRKLRWQAWIFSVLVFRIWHARAVAAATAVVVAVAVAVVLVRRCGIVCVAFDNFDGVCHPGFSVAGSSHHRDDVWDDTVVELDDLTFSTAVCGLIRDMKSALVHAGREMLGELGYSHATGVVIKTTHERFKFHAKVQLDSKSTRCAVVYTNVVRVVRIELHNLRLIL